MRLYYMHLFARSPRSPPLARRAKCRHYARGCDLTRHKKRANNQHLIGVALFTRAPHTMARDTAGTRAPRASRRGGRRGSRSPRKADGGVAGDAGAEDGVQFKVENSVDADAQTTGNGRREVVIPAPRGVSAARVSSFIRAPDDADVVRADALPPTPRGLTLNTKTVAKAVEDGKPSVTFDSPVAIRSPDVRAAEESENEFGSATSVFAVRVGDALESIDEDVSPFSHASEYPPTYHEAKIAKREAEAEAYSDANTVTALSSSEDELADVMYDVLGFEIPEALHVEEDAARMSRAEHRSHQGEYLDVYRKCARKQQNIGGDACLALAVNGVHPDHRAEIWAEKLKAHVKQNASGTSFYQYLEQGRTTLSEDEIKMIETDAGAVFPTHPRFCVDQEALSRGHSRQNSTHSLASMASGSGYVEHPSVGYCLLSTLQSILIAAAARSPHGYCAGFVVPAAIMLLLTEDEEASFWMLAGFVEDVVPHVVSRSMIPLYSEGKCVDLEINMSEPELHAHCVAGDCRPALVVAGLFTRLGVGVLPTESALRLWDALILEGGQILTPFALVMLKSMKATLMAADSKSLCDVFDDCAARMHEVSDALLDAIIIGRDAPSKFDSLTIRVAERAVTADALNDLNSFYELLEQLQNQVEGCQISRSALDHMTRSTYMYDEFYDVDTPVDKEYQTRKISDSFDAIVRLRGENADPSVPSSVTYDELMRVFRIKPATSGALKMLAVEGVTVESRVETFLLGEGGRESGKPPSEKAIKMALFVANSVLPTQRLSGAPVESKILGELATSSPQTWYSEMRMGARSGLILANFTIPLFRRGTSTNAFDVTVVASRVKSNNESPRALANAFDIVAHTQYSCLVQTADGAPYIVKKRFNDFKRLHETLNAGGCYNCMHMSKNIIGSDVGLSVDPHVVACRTVTLQRYLDQLNGCGLPKVHMTLRAFLGLDEPKTKISRLRAFCACAPLAKCDLFGFLGRSRPSKR